MARKLIVPTAADVAKKWGEVTPARAAYYESEAPAAAETWENRTVASKGTFKTAMADPKIADRFAGGVKGKAEKFRRKVTDVGVSRFGPGVSAAVGDMESGVSPFIQKLGTITIADRKPRGDPANYNIGREIGEPLHQLRLSILGATAG